MQSSSLPASNGWWGLRADDLHPWSSSAWQFVMHQKTNKMRSSIIIQHIFTIMNITDEYLFQSQQKPVSVFRLVSLLIYTALQPTNSIRHRLCITVGSGSKAHALIYSEGFYDFPIVRFTIMAVPLGSKIWTSP